MAEVAGKVVMDICNEMFAPFDTNNDNGRVTSVRGVLTAAECVESVHLATGILLRHNYIPSVH